MYNDRDCGLIVENGDRMPPGKNMDDFYTIVRSGMWRLNYKLSEEGKKRFFGEFLPMLHDTKTEVLGERDDLSWYLVYVGTRPSGRGKGYARALIEQVTAVVSTDRLTEREFRLQNFLWKEYCSLSI